MNIINIICGTRQLQLAPCGRESNGDYDDWINVWIEFSLPELKTAFKTALTVYELSPFKNGLINIYQDILSPDMSSPVALDNLEKKITLSCRKIHPERIDVNLILRPEDHADSIVVTDTFYLDQSYFPALLTGLDEMINWQS